MKESRTFKSSRKDGRYLSAPGAWHSVYKNTPPKLEFDPTMRAREFPSWQRKVRSRLRRLMCFPPAPTAPKPKMLWAKDRDGYRLEKWEIGGQPGAVIRVLLLIPDGASRRQKAPLVLCLPGSDHTKELLAGEPELRGWKVREGVPATAGHNRMGWWYAQRGMVAACVDNPGIGEQSDPRVPGRTALCANLLLSGWHYQGLAAFQADCLYRWASQLPHVDSRRVGLSGHSLGTDAGLVLALLRPDIRAMVYNNNLRSFRQWIISTGLSPVPLWHYTPGLHEWFDFTDLVAALAPRPLLVSEGGLAQNVRAVRRAYRLAGAPAHFKMVHFPKYARRATRKHEGRKVPEGLTIKAFKVWANCDSPSHYFKENIAVPWLATVLDV